MSTWQCPGCKWTFQAHDRPHDCAEYNAVRYKSRIAELESALLKINGILEVPAAEYVPAIREAWDVIEAVMRKEERIVPARIAELEAQVVQLSRAISGKDQRTNDLQQTQGMQQYLQSFKDELGDKADRALRVEAQIHTWIPLQIRAMRELRGWTQAELAAKIGTTQNAVSRLENPKGNVANVSTLQRVAEAYDVGLLVRFVPFSDFFDFGARDSKHSVAIPDYETELADLEASVNAEKPARIEDGEYWRARGGGVVSFHRRVLAQTERIAQLEAQVLAVSADRDRLCEIVLRHPCRVALEKLVARLERESTRGDSWLDTREYTDARKALEATEGEVLK